VAPRARLQCVHQLGRRWLEHGHGARLECGRGGGARRTSRDALGHRCAGEVQDHPSSQAQVSFLDSDEKTEHNASGIDRPRDEFGFVDEFVFVQDPERYSGFIDDQESPHRPVVHHSRGIQ
jgi:hypothetical protein